MILYVPIANELVGNPAIEWFIFQIAPAPASELLHYHSDSLRTFSNHYYCSVCFCVLFMLNNKNRRFQANFGNNCRWQGWRRQGSDSLEKMFLLNLICGGIHQDHQFNASAQQDVECTWLEPFWPAKLFYIIYNEGGSKTAAERIWNDKKKCKQEEPWSHEQNKGIRKTKHLL